MARGRFLNASIAADIALNSLSLEAHWLYMMTIPHLDRDGLIIADTYVFFGKVCPRRPELIPRIDALIAEWAKAGLVTVYPTHDGNVAFFHGFTKNQQGMHYAREGASVLQPPPGHVRTSTGLEPNNGDDGDPGGDTPRRPNPDPLPTNSRPTPAEVKYKDQYQVEVKEYVAPSAATPTPQQEMFGAVCEAIGWDYKTLSKEDKGQVAQAVGILGKASYVVDDIRRFMVEVWFEDWRWKKEGQHPTLKQLRQEIGKIRSVAKHAAPKKQTGMDAYREMLAEQGLKQ